MKRSILISAFFITKAHFGFYYIKEAFGRVQIYRINVKVLFSTLLYITLLKLYQDPDATTKRSIFMNDITAAGGTPHPTKRITRRKKQLSGIVDWKVLKDEKIFVPNTRVIYEKDRWHQFIFPLLCKV